MRSNHRQVTVSSRRWGRNGSLKGIASSPPPHLPSILLPSVTAATVLVFSNPATALAIGSLVFSGPLTPYLYMGIGLFLVATLLGGLLVPAASAGRLEQLGMRVYQDA